MRTLIALAAAPLLLVSVGAGPADSIQGLEGHWRCTVAKARPAQRSYFAVTSRLGPNAGRREIFGRQDTTESDGAPSAAFEHITVDPAGSNAAIESVEGKGTSSGSAPLHFRGRSYDGDAPMELTYTVSGETMTRRALRGPAAVDEESCTRETQPAAGTSCPVPNVPPSVVHAEEPEYPVDAYTAKVKGRVEVRVVIDDRSRVLWADVLNSASPLLTEAAVRSARDSTYKTAVVGCRSVAAEYVFVVEFS